MNLWEDVGNLSLAKAKELLEKMDTDPMETDLEMVERLVEIAVKIDMLDLQWEVQSRSAAAVSRGRSVCLKVGETEIARYLIDPGQSSREDED